MVGQSSPNSHFNRQLQFALRSKPSPVAVGRWECDPVAGERELIELLQPEFYKLFAELAQMKMADRAAKTINWSAAEKLFRRSWRMRRLLDFTRPYVIPKRLFREIRRARHAAIGGKGYLPTRGRPVTFNANFVAEVDAVKDRLAGGRQLSSALQVRTHRIFRLPNRSGSIKKAIKQYLAIYFGREPTTKEIANAQAVYSQRSRRS